MRGGQAQGAALEQPLLALHEEDAPAIDDGHPLGELLGLLEEHYVLPVHALEQGLIGPRHANGGLIEENQPLQIHFLNVHFPSNSHKIRQFPDSFFQAGDPRRHAPARGQAAAAPHAGSSPA